jgi:hypothetical protein
MIETPDVPDVMRLPPERPRPDPRIPPVIAATLLAAGVALIVLFVLVVLPAAAAAGAAGGCGGG